MLVNSRKIKMKDKRDRYAIKIFFCKRLLIQRKCG